MDITTILLLVSFFGFFVFAIFQSYQIAKKYRRNRLKYILIAFLFSLLIITANFALFVAIQIYIIDVVFSRYDSNRVTNVVMPASMVVSIFISGIFIVRHFRRKFKKYDASVIENIGLDAND